MKPHWHEARIKLSTLEGRDAFVKPDLKDSKIVWVYNGNKRVKLSEAEFEQLCADKSIRLGSALTLRRHRDVENSFRKAPTVPLTAPQQEQQAA